MQLDKSAREGEAIKSIGEASVTESGAIGRRETPLAKEARTKQDQSEPKAGRELADLERIAANIGDRANLERKRPNARQTLEATLPEASRQEKPDGADAIPVNANLRQSDPSQIRFDIPKKAIEEKTGVKIEEDKLYHIEGTVVGKFDFEMYRTVRNYIHYFVPVEHQHQIQPGKVHDIKIKSIREVPLTPAQSKLVSEWSERRIPWHRIVHRLNHMPQERAELNRQTTGEAKSEKQNTLYQLEKLERAENIGAIFDAESRLHRKDHVNREDRFYFRIDNSGYKQKTGMAVEEGATYRISGEIEGVGPFQKTLRSVATRQDMPIYVPHELNSKVELGKKYKITINSIERIPSVRDSWERQERPSVEWTWKEIASWIDTEGRFNSEIRGGFYADIAQKDKTVIQEICTFYDEHGLHPNMVLDKLTGTYHAHLQRVDDVATVIKNTEVYIRTQNKKDQIQKFKENLNAPRKTLHAGIRKARKILGNVDA